MRAEKTAIIKELKGKLAGTDYTFFVCFKGLNVDQMTVLRTQLRQSKSSLLVAGNAFFKRAADEQGLGDVGAFLSGPTAMITGNGEVTAVARLLKAFRKENSALAIRGGQVGGANVTEADIEAMANIPSREILLAQMVGTLAAPMSQVVGVLQQKLCSLLYALKAVEAKKAKGQ